tara:strand:- start:307 stop:1737 length:1431 start_codon:yes stop_codon:yes gene_type:complete
MDKPPKHKWLTNPLAGLDSVPKPEYDDVWEHENRWGEEVKDLAIEGLAAVATQGRFTDPPASQQTVDVAAMEVMDLHPNIYRKAVVYHRNNPDAGWSAAIKAAKLSAGSSPETLRRRFMKSPKDIYPDAGGVKNVYNPDQTELKLEPFQSNTYQRSVLNKMNKYGMGDGTFRMNAYRAYLNKGNEGRDMLEAYLSPDRLKGSFQGYKKFNKKSVEYKWGAFLEKKGYDLSQGVQVHHINPLFDSIHLFDGVKFNSKEYWSLMDILVKNNARTGAIQKGDAINNLMMTLGQATDEATPHGIAHKFYNNFTPTFFSPAEMKKINTVKGYRNKKARRWATLVNKSEEVILEAHKQWSLLNPVTASQLPFDEFNSELVNRLFKLDARGYNKLMDPKYQLPDMNSIIKEIAADKGLKGPIFKLQPKPVDLSSISKKEKTLLEAEEVFQQRQADAALRSMQKKVKPTDQLNLDKLFPTEHRD